MSSDGDTPQVVSDRGGALKVLVVEDELLIGMDLVMLLEEWGYEARGPLRRPDEAIAAIENDPPDLGILDVNLGNGQTSLPIAEELAARNIPFIFLTGYDPARYGNDDAFRKAPHLRKPVPQGALQQMLLQFTPQTGA